MRILFIKYIFAISLIKSIEGVQYYAQFYKYTESSNCNNNLHTEIGIVPLDLCIKVAPKEVYMDGSQQK